MKLFLVRHGETQKAANGVYGYSAPLTGLGHEQARLTGQLLSRLQVTHIVASDALRALQTAEPLSRALGQQPVVVPDLKEINIGAPADGVVPYQPRDRVQFVMDCSHQGGETWDEFRGRVLSGLSVVADGFEPDAVVAVFTHGGVKSVAIDHYSGREPSMRMKNLYGNGSVSTIESNGAGHTVHAVNEMEHLASLMVESEISVSADRRTAESA